MFEDELKYFMTGNVTYTSLECWSWSLCLVWDREGEKES